MDEKTHLDIVLQIINATYHQGWDDCLDAILSMISSEKEANSLRDKIESLQIIVKARKFERFRSEFKIIDSLF